MRNKIIRNRVLIIADILMCMLAYLFVLTIRFNYTEVFSNFVQGISFIVFNAVLYCVALYAFAVYKVNWIYAGSKDYGKLLSGCIITAVVMVIVGISLYDSYYFKLNIAANFTTVTLICAIRFAIRLFYKINITQRKNNGKNVLIVGAGSLAVMLLRDIQENSMLNYQVVGLVDDDAKKHKTYIYGTQVLGGRDDIEKICEERDIEEIIFAIHNAHYSEKNLILNICSKTGCKVKILPGVEDSLNNGVRSGKLRDVEIEDLLAREPVKLDNKLISDDISGKTILVTGGGGSIGSELCRQIIGYNPEKIIILDIYENTAYEVQNELCDNYKTANVDVVIASVRDKKRLDEIFAFYKPDIVFHAAAHKHVPLMEFSPSEAIKNNVFGTYNVASCALEHGVTRFVMISTDKAVNPTNIMGATKRVCEMIIQTFSKLGKTEFMAVRFGNVLGSHGSVVPRFKSQIASGGPVTVTHPEITRFFMTIPEAAQLVLQAASYAKGGEIFVLDMGEPVKIYDLAKNLIQLSGFVPDKDIKIEFTGLRDGEKLYEELLMSEEGLAKTAHSKIFIGQPMDIDIKTLEEKLDILRNSLEKDNDQIKKDMELVVPTYHAVNNL